MKNKHAATEITSFKLEARFMAAPFDFIEEFVSNYHHYRAMNDLEYLFLGINSRKMRKRIGSASDTLFFCEQLEMLMEACWLILQTDPEGDTGWVTMDQLDETFFFSFFLFSKENEKYPWSVLPRHLDADQFCRPMLAIRKFFKKKSLSAWKSAVNLLLHNMLSKSLYGDFQDDNNTFEQHFHLAAMMEASHLIHIRTQQYFVQIMETIQKNQQEEEDESRSDDCVELAADDTITVVADNATSTVTQVTPSV